MEANNDQVEAQHHVPPLLNLDSTEGTGWRAWAKRAILLGFSLFVIAGLCGAYDRSAESDTTVDTARLQVEYPHTTRAGSDIALELRIESGDGLPTSFQLGIDRNYMGLFEDLDVRPTPESETTAADGSLLLEFAPNAGSSTAWISITGRTTDGWTPQTTGALSLSGEGLGPFDVFLRTWKLP